MRDFLVLALGLALVGLCQGARRRNDYQSSRRGSGDQSFDMLVLSLTWPTTNCMEWKEKSNSNQCYIPKREWTIHGLWPNKKGEIGPAFCDDSKRYNRRIVNNILDQMKNHWADIHNADNRGHGLWGHEWNKHGTCAKTIPELDTPIEYFEATIALKKKHDVKRILDSNGIVPGEKYTFKEIFDALRNDLGAKPAVQCQLDDETGQKTLAEIRLCFGTDLEIIDCDGIKGGLNQFCPRRAQDILYTNPTRYIKDLPPASNTRSQSNRNSNSNHNSNRNQNVWGNPDSNPPLSPSNSNSGPASNSNSGSGFSWAQAAGGSSNNNRNPNPPPPTTTQRSNSGGSWASVAGSGNSGPPATNTRSQSPNNNNNQRKEVEEPAFSWANVASRNLGEGKKPDSTSAGRESAGKA